MFNSKRYVRRSTPGLKKVAAGNNELYADLLKLSKEVFGDMGMVYEKGKTHKQSGASMMDLDEFMFYYSLIDLNLPQNIQNNLVNMLWQAYKDGYNGVKR